MSLRCLRIRVDCTNGGDWSVTFDSKVLGNGIHLFHVWKRSDRLVKCYIMCILIWVLIGAKWFIKLFCVGYEIYKQERCGRRLRPVCACAQVGQSLPWSSIRYKNVHSPSRSQSTSRTYRSLIDNSNFNWIWLIGVCFRHPSLNTD